MAAAGWIKFALLAYVSRPKCDRQLYRLVKRNRVHRIVEVGIDDVERSIALVEVAQRYTRDQQVCYTGLDWFDSRAVELPALTLKQAHRALQVTSAQVRLVPGEPGQALVHVANAHANTDLILISKLVGDQDLQRAWFFVPRMLHSASTVLRAGVDAAGEPAIAPLSLSELAERAGRRAA